MASYTVCSRKRGYKHLPYGKIEGEGETGVMDMGMAEMVKFVIDIGITPVLLIVFVRYFIRQDEKRQQSVQKEYDKAQEKIADIEKAAKERENVMLAAAQQRELLMQGEAAKRENLIRKEAEKREGILMTNLERITNTMEDISRSMQDIQVNIGKIDDRIDRLELGGRT